MKNLFEKAPPEINWIAVDEDGPVWYYSHEPFIRSDAAPQWLPSNGQYEQVVDEKLAADIRAHLLAKNNNDWRLCKEKRLNIC